MKTETGSSASFASLAALAASAFLVSAAWAASWAAAAASSLDFALALAASSCVCSSSTCAAAFCFWSSAPPLGLSGLAAARPLCCDRERGIGASLGQFKLAQRRRERGRLLHRKGGSVLRLLSQPGGLLRLAGERFGARRRGRDGLRFRDEQRRMGKLDRLRVTRRDDHTRAD